MDLYSLNGTTAVTDGGVLYEAGPGGVFDFPDEVATRLHGFAIGGKPLWETGIERQHRLIAEEAARRADPRTLLEAVEQLVGAAHAAAATPAPPPPPEPPQSPPEPPEASRAPASHTAKAKGRNT